MGFNFNKINIERKSNLKKDYKINTNINIPNISETKSDFINTKESLIIVHFNYVIAYSPDIAELSFEGNLLLSMNPKDSKEILNEWKKKAIPSNFKEAIFNIVFRKCNLKAFQFEEEMNLPLHLPMPILKGKKED